MITATTCPLDCPGACALLAEIQEGRLTNIKGDPSHPFTQGVICGKVSRYHQLQHGPRVTTPMVRTGSKGSGGFQAVSWDHALDLVASRFQEIGATFGGEAILPYYYGGTLGLMQRQAVDRLTHRAGYSRLDRTICYPIGFAGWRAGVGKAVGPDPATIAQSDLAILWGINAVSTHITLMEHVKRARKQGARLVVVDPYQNRTARLADLHIPLRPGSDAALAVAMMQVLLAEGLADLDYLARFTDFDDTVAAHLARRTPEWAAPLTGLDPETIRALARAFGTARAPFIRIGLGMSRQNNGAVNVHAVSCLPALTGAWARGGGALFATGDAFPTETEPVRQTAWMTRPTRVLDMSRLGEWLNSAALDPPVKGLYVCNANPAVVCPEAGRVRQGLLREDLFTVVHEQVWSDTALLADVVLPATTFLEHLDLYKSYGQYTLQVAEAVLPATGLARCNHDVINDLARRLGFDDPPFQWDQETMAAQVLTASGLPHWRQWPGRWLDFAPSAAAGHFLGGFPQPDGRFHFRPGWEREEMPPLPDHWPVNRRDRADEAGRYPLDFLTPPAHEVLNSTFSGVAANRAKREPPELWLHPVDATARGIASGDKVKVFNDLGTLTMTARVTGEVRAGVCLCESNHGAGAFPEGMPLNLLSHAGPVAPDGGPAFHDNRVEVIKA